MLKLKIYDCLNSIGKSLGLAASIWGSLTRDELTELSDIDIIIFSFDGKDYSEIIINHLKAEIKQPFIWDISFTGKDIYQYALANGTNYHSIFFSDLIVGDPKAVSIFTDSREKLRLNKELALREFFNLFTSYWGLAHCIQLNDDRYSKFSLNGTNKWVRLFQACQIRWKLLIGKSAIEIIEFLSERFRMNKEPILKDYLLTFNNRKNFEQGIACDKLDGHNNAWNLLLYKIICDCMDWLQPETGLPKKFLFAFVAKMGSSSTDLILEKPRLRSSILNNLLLAFLANSKEDLESMVQNTKHDWWAMTNLSVNPLTPKEILDKIAFPDFEVDHTLWKSIRLYVSKNKNTSIATLEKIIATPNLREQDYKAALANMGFKKNQG